MSDVIDSVRKPAGSVPLSRITAKSMAPSRTSIVLAFAAIYLIWGSTYLGIRVAIETMPPFLMAGMRFAIAGSVLFLVLLVRNPSWPTSVQWRDQAVIGVLLLLGGNAVVSWAELHTPSGITPLILGASPVVLMAMDWIRPGGKRPTKPVAIGMAVGIVGIVLLLGPGGIPAGYRPRPIDIAALFFSSVSWWIGSLYSKHSKSRTPPLMAAAMQMLIGSSSMLLTGWLLGESGRLHFASVSPRSWLALGYLVVVGSIIAFPVYVWLLEHSTPAKVSTYAYVNPVVALILGWAILGEPLNLRIFAAASVIIGAVVIITIGKTRTVAEP
jgi:drug/metabolite transporter (DMT)-like permease